MECFEHELIGLIETGGIDLRFGNAQAMLQIVEMIPPAGIWRFAGGRISASR
jgi:hypothetical protein